MINQCGHSVPMVMAGIVIGGVYCITSWTGLDCCFLPGSTKKLTASKLVGCLVDIFSATFSLGNGNDMSVECSIRSADRGCL